MASRKSLLLAALGAILSLSVAAQTPFIPNKHLYPEISAAQHDIAAGIARARKEHKRVLLDFGGDWCGDCQVLDIYANQEPNADLLAKYFVKVNVNIGHMDANREIVQRYNLPDKGVPELVVLDGHGKVIYAQHKEFSSMRNMQASDLTAFLEKWKQ
jgi:thiol:disulfide interchange protein